MKHGHCFPVGYLSLLMTLGACTPNVINYYQPSLEGAEIVVGNCVPAKRGAKFMVNGLEVSAGTFVSKSKLNVLLNLNPLPGQRIYFSSNKFQVIDFEHGMRVIEPSIFTDRIDKVNSPSVPFPSVGSKPSPLGFNFNIYISFPDGKLETFELLSPAIIIDGVRKEFPVIRFQRKTWIGISPLNC